MKPHILLIDDSETTQAAISSVLTSHDYLLTTVSNGADGLAQLEVQQYDLVLLDYGLPDTDGLRLLQNIVAKQPDLPVVMVTGRGSERIAVNALKSGASDYVVKSNDFVSKLPHIIRDNLEKYEMRRRNRELESQLRESYKQLKRLNADLEEKVQGRTEELERAYQLSNELMAKAVDSNMQLAELYSEVDESRRKLDTKIRELSLLNDVGKTMASTFDRDTLLQVAIDAVHQELDVEHCAILLVNEENHRLQIGASHGTPDDLLLATKLLAGEQILFDVIRKGEPLLIQDIESHEEYAVLVKDYPDLECFMLVPLRFKQLEIGILTTYGKTSQETFSRDDLAFVSSLASQASIALANISLTNQRIQDERLATLDKIMRYLMQNMDASLETIRLCAAKMSHEAADAHAAEETVQTLEHEVEQIRGIGRELLEFSQGQEGTLLLQPVNIETFVQEVVAALEASFKEQNISIQTRLDYTGSLTIDRHKMKRVFLNIAENARQAMTEGGSLTMTSREENGVVHFEFIDTGCGMSLDVQNHIFEPFAAGEQSHDTGLGMTIVKKILDEHQARIDVQSVLAKGTTIRVSLPRVQRACAEE